MPTASDFVLLFERAAVSGDGGVQGELGDSDLLQLSSSVSGHSALARGLVEVLLTVIGCISSFASDRASCMVVYIFGVHLGRRTIIIKVLAELAGSTW